jgi:OOP family OmpA-OmpF porin
MATIALAGGLPVSSLILNKAVKSWTALALLVLCLPLLAACESLKEWSDSSASGSSLSGTLAGAPVSEVPEFPVPQDRDLKVMTSKLSGGSVEIYDLESGMPMGGGVTASVPPVQPAFDGIPMATDPRVTVYPLDGGALNPSYVARAPVPQWPNATLPMGGDQQESPAGLMPSPAGWSDTPMQIEDGRLSPRRAPGIASVYFNYGSARLGSPERSILRDVAEEAKFAPVDRVNVEGHASRAAQTNDPIKAKILNLKESMNRAQAVSQNLIESGVPGEKIKTVGWGDTKQIAGGEADQRRVDIFTGIQ